MPAGFPNRQSFSARVADLTVSLDRRGLNQRKLATVGAALLAAGVAYHVVFGANGLTVYEQKRHETRTLETEMKDLQHENDLLKTHVDHLQSDPDAIMHQAHQDLHYTRPGEVIYRLENSSEPAGPVQGN